MGTKPRSLLAAAGALALGLTLAAIPASAGRATSETLDDISIWCTSDSAIEGADATTKVHVEFSAYYAPDGTWRDGWSQVLLQESPAGEEQTVEVTEYWGYMGEGSFGDGAFDASFMMWDVGVEGESDPVGTLAYTGTAVPLGDPDEIDDRTRDGNRWSTMEGWVQQLEVAVTTIAADGDALEIADDASFSCMGAEQHLTFFSTNPATTVYHSSSLGGAYCELGEDGILMLDLSEWGGFGVVAFGIDWETETAEAIFAGDIWQDGDTIGGMLPQVYPEPDPETEPDPEAEPVEPAYANLDLTIGAVMDHGVLRMKTGDYSVLERYTVNELTGTITTDEYGELPVSCEIRVSDVIERYFSKAGPKPGGQPPANDLPEDARLLADGATARVNTRGAAEEAEVPCMVSYQVGEDEFVEEPLPFGRTVWYEFAGTGGPVELSTAGSDFDTVLGVYTVGEAGYEQVVCVDDSEAGLQASTSVDTVEGVQYLVQAGGFGWDYGKLVVARD